MELLAVPSKEICSLKVICSHYLLSAWGPCWARKGGHGRAAAGEAVWTRLVGEHDGEEPRAEGAGAPGARRGREDSSA